MAGLLSKEEIFFFSPPDSNIEDLELYIFYFKNDTENI